MRHAMSPLLLFMFYLMATVACSAQPSKVDPCPVGPSPRFQTEARPSAVEIAHRVILTTPPDRYSELYFGDIAFILLCGSPEDAQTLFTKVFGKTVRMDGATVIEADAHSIRVYWNIEGACSKAFRFHFETSLETVPAIGSKVLITGTYASYKRDEFLINLSNSYAAPIPTAPH